MPVGIMPRACYKDPYIISFIHPNGRKIMSGSQTLVVKLGTSVLTGGSRRLNRAHIVELVRQCAQQHAKGHRIVIVTSGAIAAGREHLGYPNYRPPLPRSNC